MSYIKTIITNILKDKLPLDLIDIIYNYAKCYPHKINDKYHNMYNDILKKIPRIAYTNIKNMYMYYEPKNERDEWGDWFERSNYYNEIQHVSPYVYFLYYLRALGKLYLIKEITNCKIDDREEYFKNLDRHKIKINCILFDDY
jgi:hypothetical protein